MEPCEGDYSHMEMEYCLEMAAKLPQIGGGYSFYHDSHSQSSCVNSGNSYVFNDLGSVPEISTMSTTSANDDGYWPVLEYDERQLVTSCSSSTGTFLSNCDNHYGGCTNNFEAVPTYTEPCLFAEVDQPLFCDTAVQQQYFQRSNAQFTGDVTVPSPTVSSLDSAMGGSTRCSPVSAVDGNFPHFMNNTYGNMRNLTEDCFGYSNMQQKQQPVDSSYTSSMCSTIFNNFASEADRNDVSFQYSSGGAYGNDGTVNGWMVYRDQRNYVDFNSLESYSYNNNGHQREVITVGDSFASSSSTEEYCSSGGSSPHLPTSAPIAYYSAAPMTGSSCGASKTDESISCCQKPVAVERKMKMTVKKATKRYANPATVNPFLAVAAAASATASIASSTAERNDTGVSGDAAMMAEQIRRNAEISWAMSPFRRLEAEQLRQRKGGANASLLSGGARRRPPNIRRKFSLMTSVNICSGSSGSAMLSSAGAGVQGPMLASLSRKRRRAETCTCASSFTKGFGDATKTQHEIITTHPCRKCSSTSAVDGKMPAPSNLSARRWQSEVWTKIRHATSVGAGANFAKVVAASGGCGGGDARC